MSNKFVRSEKERMLGGVCGGLAQYFNIDVTLVRVFFVLLTIASGIGVAVYFLLWVIAPSARQQGGETGEYIKANAEEIAEKARNLGQEIQTSFQRPNPRAPILVGGALVVLGIIILLNNLNLFLLRWIRFDLLWPLLLIIAGVALLRRRG